eukprot:TRINITY_DN22908_c0_g1_i1.p1 TRINITY_DN22908_c0_g1~~TRINITY_DN22908_c0_g1_i1.p1  ORF type:complete len:696 (-),score=122.43 TRINITY_DN22908_c0_g1_i1:185-2272(-)
MEWVMGGAAMAYVQATNLWYYNRTNWQWDQVIRQNYIHQVQNMRLAQGGLFREDLRDLFAMTTSKMDKYTTVATLQLGFAINLFYDLQVSEVGRPWLIRIHAMSCVCSIIFITLAIWLSIYASLCAQSYAVRVLTQAVRLPLPSEAAIAFAGPDASQYERQILGAFRIPFLMGKLRRSLAPRVSREGREEAAAPHFFLFRRLQRQWGIYSAYARVSFSIGTFFLMSTQVYFGIVIYVVGLGHSVTSLVYGLAFLLTVFILIQLELHMSICEKILTVPLLIAGPAVAYVTAMSSSDGVSQRLLSAGALMASLLQALWQLWVFNTIAKTDPVTGQPSRLRSARMTDIVSWLRLPSGDKRGGHTSSGSKKASDASQRPSGLANLGPESMVLDGDTTSLLRRVDSWLGLFEQLERTKPGEYLTSEQAAEIQKMRIETTRLQQKVRVSRTRASGKDQKDWVHLAYVDEKTGRPRNFWVRVSTGEEVWKKPTEDAPDLMDVALLLRTARGRVEPDGNGEPEPCCPEAEMQQEAVDALDDKLHLPNDDMLESERLLPQRVFRVAYGVMMLLWVLVCYSAARSAHEVWTQDAHWSLGAPATETVRALAASNSCASLARHAAAADHVPRVAEGAPVDEVALGLAALCGEPASTRVAAARRLARRLRAEADLGDGCLSEEELSLWLDAGARPCALTATPSSSKLA